MTDHPVDVTSYEYTNGPGGTRGPAMTFGFRAGRAAATATAA